MKKQFLWETHMHTSQSSRCGRVDAATMIKAYYQAGYQGVVITDHFVNGYSAASRTAPWDQRMDTVFSGFRAAKLAGDSLGMVVLAGIEYYWEGADFITLGLPLSFYYDQSDLCAISIEEYARRVHAAGGFLSQAHPYREASYINGPVEKRCDLVDAIETINGSHAASEQIWNDKALMLSVQHHLLQTAGSDAHTLYSAATAALSFQTPPATEDEFLHALRAGEGRALRLRYAEKPD